MSRWRTGTFSKLVNKPYLFSRQQFIDRQSVGIQRRTFTVTSTANMKFVQFTYKGNPNEIRVGYLHNDKVVDINKSNPELPSTMLGILQKNYLDRVVSNYQQCCCTKDSNPAAVPLSNVNLMAPITGMDKVMCIGLNYADHCKEQNLEQPKVPMMFSKFGSTVTGPSQAIRLRTDIVKKADWEVELVVVIGEKCTNVKAADAYKYVLGYTVAQDITARDWQKEQNAGQFLLGKAQDTFCPIGPCIATKDEVGDPQTLNIKCSVNGVEKQSSNTSNLIHKIPDVIERLTSLMTLLPGDIILTGTPGGVGVHRNPPEFLQPGDVLRSEIEKIGHFEIKVEKF